MNQDEMTLVEHLRELRKRLLWVLVALVAGMAIGLLFAKKTILFLTQQPPARGMELNAFSPWEPIRIYMNFGLLIGLLLVLPVALYHIWAFVKPGLRPVEQRATLAYIPFATLLFLVGLGFGYFVVFPMAFMFGSNISHSIGIKETYGMAQYFGFMFNILLPVALVFELPIIVMFLTRLRLLNPQRLSKLRRYAYMALVIIAAVITPPDALSAIIVFIPMVLLYEFSVLLSRLVYRKQVAQDLAWEAEYGAK
ncbi:preprotein translocase subunit TatC [Gordoniibacillus kamchatkensis]|uniref:Sec-independent protein translocase protein TatC n=1 Tax=Gordoniibacillus kamchatkensis TaxID=1590651 RepID=A0ABR5ADP2_9BACL|nr:twin-arginine translocase subunit TatC [Paenibacillus sp. VKM B-2647]KIL38710.1 preprotein translocase subunit TatC [Paenibacillus sp. VKM B-2647]